MEKEEVIKNLVNVKTKMDALANLMEIAKKRKEASYELRDFLNDIQEFCQNHGKTIEECYLAIIKMRE